MIGAIADRFEFDVAIRRGGGGGADRSVWPIASPRLDARVAIHDLAHRSPQATHHLGDQPLEIVGLDVVIEDVEVQAEPPTSLLFRASQ